MKVIPFVVAMASAVTLSPKVAAQGKTVQEIENSIDKKGKYAILVQNSKHFMAAVMTGEEFKVKSDKIQFEIILVGEVLQALIDEKELLPVVQKADHLGIRIVVCGFAMSKMGIEKSQYPASILITSNGFSYLFGLQENGFKTFAM